MYGGGNITANPGGRDALNGFHRDLLLLTFQILPLKKYVTLNDLTILLTHDRPLLKM